MNVFERFLQNVRRADANRGYTCDFCGREIFNYPTPRTCDECERSFRKPSEKSCEKCGRVTWSDGVCLSCKSDLPVFTRGISAFCYADNVAALVNRFKNGKRRLGVYLAEKMTEAFLNAEPPLPIPTDSELLLVPVPLTRDKERIRGYNQAQVLAETLQTELSKRGFHARVDLEILQKVKNVSFQKDLDYKQRKENASLAYHVHKRSACKGKTIIVIDDIMTTGATGNACADKLFRAGAQTVYFLTAAALPEKSVTK